MPKCDVALVAGIPTTTPTRTLIDLGAVVREEALELALEDALRRRLTSPARIEWRLAELCTRGRNGCATLRHLLQEREGVRPTESALETRVARLIRKSDLPEPVRQFEVRDGDRFVARVDFAYPAELVAIEADGFRWHSGRRDWEREIRWRNGLQALGWTLVDVTDGELRNNGQDVIVRLRSTLRARGHQALM